MKYVPKDQVLYTGYNIKVKPAERMRTKKRAEELMDQNVSPKPNKSILGMYPGLWFYYKAGDVKKEKGFRYFVKNKLGQVPIYMSDVDAEKTATLLKGHLINNGFFQAEVKPETKIDTNKRKGKVTYTATVYRPYRLKNIDYPTNSTLFKNIDSIKQDSYLRPRQRYVLDRLQAEQERIEEELENYGYYFFDDRHLLFEADSTVGDKKIDLLLTLENGVPEKAKRIYSVDEITIYPNYTITRDSVIRLADTTKIDGYNYIDRTKSYRPEIITRVINLQQGKIYRREDREYTLSHLMSLGSFKFVDIKFKESPKDSALLDAHIYLTPYLKKSLRAEIEAASKSNNFVGPGVTLQFTNRNFLRGSERFNVTVTSGYEVQISRKIPEPLNAFELGIESSLSVPRFITPFRIHYPNRKYLPTTDFKLGMRLQQRIGYFRLNSFNLGYGYTWRENTLKTHELYPVDINYMKLGKTSDDFNDLLRSNPVLAKSLENQFIMGARYSFTLNTQVNEKREEQFSEKRYEKSQFFLNAKAETAGNLIHLARGGEFDNDLNNDSLKIFGSAYAQFVRGETDFRYYWQLSEKTKLANRILVGAGYAYGNSFTMPYIRQFATGGSNSIRAFPARSIGPGTYYVRDDPSNENSIGFIDQRGDLKLEGSTELRHDFSKVIKGAIFVDAGNIWLWRENESLTPPKTDEGTELPDFAYGKFSGHSFLNELAVGTGFGVRFDFNFFVLRFDLAFPLRKPWLADGHRWVLDDLNLKDSDWRKENLIFNIAIGYPF
jgi:outer membrane protein insertion porin family